MKKLFFTALLGLLFQVSGFSQRFYVRAGGGYAWPSASQHMALQYQVNYNAVTNVFTETFAYKKGSYGAGLNAMLTSGYSITEHLGAEVSVSYLAGKTYAGSRQYTGSTTGSRRSETYGRMPALAAGLVISTAGPHWRPYAKAGVVVGQPRIFVQEQSAFGNNLVRQEWKVSGEKAWGFQGGLGLQYNFSARWGLFLEGLFRSLAFVPEKGRITSYERNGQDQYGTLSIRQRELVFKSSYTQSSNDQGADHMPSQARNTPFAFGAAGLQLGLQVNLR